MNNQKENQKTIVTTAGIIRVTIEQIELPNGTTIYKATGRRLGKMEYTRDFQTLHAVSCFVNRSAGQSIRRMFERTYTDGFKDGYKTAVNETIGRLRIL